MAEASGNALFAAQLYDQAIWFIGSSIGQARQYGIPVTGQALFSFAWCSFGAARVKYALGQAPPAFAHLQQALDALNQAIVMNPNVALYHAAAGTVLMAQGNLPVAEQAFTRAVQLNPADAQAQWMLSAVHRMQGNTAAANLQYNAAQQNMAGLPHPADYFQQQPAAQSAGGGNTLDTISKVLDIANKGFDLFGNFQKYMGANTNANPWG